MNRADIRLIAIDLDGTLLRDDKTVSPRVRAAILACTQRSVRVVIASARPPRTVRTFYEQLQLDTPQINYNGALIWDPPTKSVLDHRPIRAEVASEMIARARQLAPDVLVSCEILDRWHTDRVDPNFLTATARIFGPDVIAPIKSFGHLDVTKLMLMGPPAMMDQLATVLAHEQVKLARTDPDLLQYMSIEAGKGNGLRRLCERVNVDLQQTMAIGDNDNDIEMLDVAGLAVAMGHAAQRVKMQADVVVASNQADGVAEAIERWVLRTG